MVNRDVGRSFERLSALSPHWRGVGGRGDPCPYHGLDRSCRLALAVLRPLRGYAGEIVPTRSGPRRGAPPLTVSRRGSARAPLRAQAASRRPRSATFTRLPGVCSASLAARDAALDRDPRPNMNMVLGAVV